MLSPLCLLGSIEGLEIRSPWGPGPGQPLPRVSDGALASQSCSEDVLLSGETDQRASGEGTCPNVN